MQKSNRLPGLLLVHARWVLIAVTALSGMSRAGLAADAPKPGTDVVVFSNGDQLTGKLLYSDGGKLVFHSDIAGDVKVGWDKVKELKSSQQFAVLQKGQKVNKKTPDSQVPQGTLSATASDIQLQSAAGTSLPLIPTKNAEFVVEEATFQKELRHEPGFFHEWNGSVSAGAAFVIATQNSQNFNVGIALAQVVPNVAWMSPRTRTMANFTDIYGKVHQPGVQDTKTSIFHGDAEHDWYLSPRFYALADLSYDHNYSQGLSLQQIYGGGFGYSVIQQPKQHLDVKADVHYERQSFSADTYAVPVPPVQPSVNLVGSSLGESCMRKLPAGLVFNEAGVVNISFNNTNAYSSNVAAGLVFPVYKRLSFNLGAVDGYLNNPPVGFKNNSFQFTAGVGYTLR
jgi:hypothetical protein